MGAIFGFTGRPDEQLLNSMRDSLSHRGDHFSSHQTDQATIACLARHPSSNEICGSGLLSNESQAIALAGLVLSDGRSEPSLSRVLRRISKHGKPSADLSGDYVLASLDFDSLRLVRDGAGARTVYFGRHQERFFFASEPKALWQLPGFPREILESSLAKYLAFSFVPEQATMLRGISELPAGHVLTIHNGESRLERFFTFEDSGDEPTMTDDDWVDRFRATLADSIAKRLPRSGPATVFLSGGLDSSVVTAELVRQATTPVQSYALHFGEKYPNELSYAAAVARRCGTDHTEVLIEPRDFLPRLRRMIWHLDDPIGDPITMPNFELASRVAEQSSWVFNGEGGDPCFGGPKNLPMLLGHWYGGIERGPNFREQAYLASYRRGYEELSRLLAPDVRRQVDEQRDLEEVLTPYFRSPHPANFLDKLNVINIRLKGAHLILPKVERMLSAFGIAPLSPLFSMEMIRLSFQIPSSLKLNAGIEKVILKRAYENDLPREVIERPKSGMRVPVHFWFQGELKRYARHILSPRELKRVGIFDHKRVKQLLDYQTEEGPGRYGLRIWMLLTFEIWRRIVVDGESI